MDNFGKRMMVTSATSVAQLVVAVECPCYAGIEGRRSVLKSRMDDLGSGFVLLSNSKSWLQWALNPQVWHSYSSRGEGPA